MSDKGRCESNYLKKWNDSEEKCETRCFEMDQEWNAETSQCEIPKSTSHEIDDSDDDSEDSKPLDDWSMEECYA